MLESIFRSNECPDLLPIIDHFGIGLEGLMPVII